MQGLYTSMVAIVFIVIAINFFVLFLRFKKNRFHKIVTPAKEEKEAALLRDRVIMNRLQCEQDEAARYVELRNKTLDLYEQVRRNAAAAEAEAQASVSSVSTDIRNN